ncbi:MAG: hypothetical protein K0V04_38800 [Deltaproteobacteria bacterium]|nr:hypothetical protein [Deltaproteobacteria bacterium]
MTSSVPVVLSSLAMFAVACSIDSNAQGGPPTLAQTTGSSEGTANDSGSDGSAGADDATGTPIPAGPRRRRLDLAAAFVGRPEATLAIIVDASRIEYADCQPDGSDVRFFGPETGSPYPSELEHWDPSGTSVFWVRVEGPLPEFLWMYYADGERFASVPTPTVWDDDFAAVWHMVRGDDDDILDATSPGIGLRPTDFAGDFDVPGQLGLATHVEPSPGGVAPLRTSSADELALPNGFTIEAWVLLDEAEVTTTEFIAHKPQAYQLRARETLVQRPSLVVHTPTNLGGVAVQAAGSLSTTTWTYVAATYEPADGALVIFRDGAPEMTTTLAPPNAEVASSTELMTVGEGMRGVLDEVRVSHGARSVDWISLQHASMRDALLTFGAPEAR